MVVVVVWVNEVMSYELSVVYCTVLISFWGPLPTYVVWKMDRLITLCDIMR